MVLDREVDTKTKLFGECYESVCGNDAGWVYFVNQAMEVAVEITSMVEDVVWAEALVEIININRAKLSMHPQQIWSA